MSEFEPEFDYADEFDYVDPVEALEADGQPIGPVELAALELEYERAGQVDPGAYEPLSNLTPAAEGLMDGAQVGARQQLAQEGYERELVSQVAEIAAEYGISSPEAIRQVASEVDSAKQALFTRFLAEGFDVGQAGQAVDDADVDGAIRAGIEQVRYVAVTNGDPSLRAWRAGRTEAARTDAQQGRPSGPDIFDHPSLRKLNEVTSAYAEREAQRRAVWARHFENKGYR